MPPAPVQDPSQPVQPLESWMLSTLRWTRGILFVCIFVAASAAVVGVLVDQNRAAQASWFAQAQLGKQRDDRREELRNALKALVSLHDELKKSVSGQGSDAGQAGSSQRWQQQLFLVRQIYRLNGPVPGFARANVRAEEALRDACVALSSLQRLVMSGDLGEEYAALEISVQRSLEQAKADLDF